MLPTETEPPHNPGARLIKYDRQTGRQLDILQYYVDLPTANQNKHVNWTLGYVATSEYDIPDIMPESLEALVNRLQDPTSPYFKKYVTWYNTNAARDYPCTALCHSAVVCGFRHLEENEFNRCITAVSKSSSLFILGQMFVAMLLSSTIYCLFVRKI